MALERRAERRFGSIADGIGDLPESRPSQAQHLAGLPHAQQEQITHGRLAHEFAELRGKHRPGEADIPRHRLDRPRVGAVVMHDAQRLGDEGIAQPSHPAGLAGACDVMAQGARHDRGGQPRHDDGTTRPFVKCLGHQRIDIAAKPPRQTASGAGHAHDARQARERRMVGFFEGEGAAHDDGPLTIAAGADAAADSRVGERGGGNDRRARRPARTQHMGIGAGRDDQVALLKLLCRPVIEGDLAAALQDDMDAAQSPPG